MYSVMIVDDEPAAISYMRTIIQKKCPGYNIIATANDGREALEKVRNLKPDVLVFDIRMPKVDGLAMSAKIKEWNLPIIMVVVSGYSEFEYARKALQNGAVDYLLKPVVPDDVKKLFDKIAQDLEMEFYKERMKILSLLYKDVEIPEGVIKKYFGSQKFFIALARAGGLPVRFSAINAREVFSEVYEMMITYGRDEMENLYLCPVALLDNDSFEEIIRNQIKKVQDVNDYCTLILGGTPVSCNQICEAAKQMYHLLDNNVILGKDNVILIENYKEKKIEVSEEEKNLLGDFDYYIEKQDYLKLKQILHRLFFLWDRDERPLLWIERRIRNMSIGLEYTDDKKKYDENYIENEYAIEDAFSNSQTLEQLILNVEEILFKDKHGQLEEQKLDTESFVERVCNYLKEYLAKEITAQDVSREFGISQRYLGKLFRKYKDMSFQTYLTMTRMEKAKELMQENKDILIKDVAERLGYRDQFYFSRVFRSYTGMCPSDFVEMGKQK